METIGNEGKRDDARGQRFAAHHKAHGRIEGGMGGGHMDF